MNKIKDIVFQTLIWFHEMKRRFFKSFSCTQSTFVSFISEEFFHEELRGYGGFGSTVRNCTDYFNLYTKDIFGDVQLSTLMDIGKPMMKRYHNADVYLKPHAKRQHFINNLRYINLINRKRTDVIVTLDYYPSYEEIIMAQPNVPVVIWIKDPRDKIEWEKISTVLLERKALGKENIDEMIKLQLEKEKSIKRVLEHSQKHNRKVIFGTQAYCLTDIAKRTYGLDDIDPIYLPNTLKIPNIENPRFTQKPSLCFLGRLDPIKRPWIYFELAKRFPKVDFYVAGITHYPKLMNDVIDRYRDVKNLKLMGLVTGEAKEKMLNSIWGIINTSVHEALPVSYLEAFSYKKTVVGCQDPDQMISQFGIYTGEILGNGYDDDCLNKFSEGIETILSSQFDRIGKGKAARRFVEEHYSHERFEKAVREDIIEKIVH